MHKMVLAINPGSTSTKFAVFHDSRKVICETIRHCDQEMMAYQKVAEQLNYRKEMLLACLRDKQFDLQTLDAAVGRGGLLKPLQSGTYQVNELLLDDVRSGKFGEHASNLGAIIAHEIASGLGIPAFIVDPVGVDELMEESRLSGLAEIERISQVHALNIKAVARNIAGRLEKPLEELNFVVAHIGGGISVAAHRKGRIIDVNNADNEGPFSPERTGTLPAKQLVKLCYAGKYTEKEMLANITKLGGVYSYLGTKSMVEVEDRVINGDQKAALVLDAMVHQIGKEIGAMATVLEGAIDGIILTGGLCHSELIVEKITKKIRFIADVFVVPGEEELEALAAGALRVLNQEEPAKAY